MAISGRRHRAWVLGLVGALWLGCAEGYGTEDRAANPVPPVGNGDGGGTTNVPEGAAADETDSGKPSEGGVDASTPRRFTYGSCPTFTKCGGTQELVGNWQISGGCVLEDTFTRMKQTCPGLKESNVVLHAWGTIDIAAASVARQTTFDFSARVNVAKNCRDGFVLTCNLMEPFLKSDSFGFAFDTASCVEDTADAARCNCDIAAVVKDDVAGASRIDNGVLTTSPGQTDQRTFEFCATTQTCTFQETTNGNPFKALIDVTRR